MSGRTAAFLFRYLLVLSIGLAPMIPAFAASKSDTGEHAGHAYMYFAGKVTPGDPMQPHSGKHLNCNGHCCLACGMSVVHVPIVLSNPYATRTVQTPTVGQLYPHLVVTVPHRPPRTLS